MKDKKKDSEKDPDRKNQQTSDDVAENSGIAEPVTESKRLHLRIARANWKRIEDEIEAFNHDPERIAPKISTAHVINRALARYFGLGEGGN